MRQWPRGIAVVFLVAISGCAGGPKMGPNLVDPDAPDEFTVTETGIKYRIRRRGLGNSPAAHSTVVVEYRGWLDDGTVFDSSYKRKKPAEFPLGTVIPGWTQGLQLVSEGGMIELEIPSRLGYGERGQPDGGIPPNATLHFLIELVKVK